MRTSDLIGTRQAADMLGVDVATVNRMAAGGELRVAMQMPGVNGARLYRPIDVERLASRRARASAPKRKAGAA